MKIAIWAATIAIVGGLAILFGYWLIEVLGALFDDDVPILIRIAVPAAFLGFAVLLAVVVIQRIQDSKDEDLEEIEY